MSRMFKSGMRKYYNGSYLDMPQQYTTDTNPYSVADTAGNQAVDISSQLNSTSGQAPIQQANQTGITPAGANEVGKLAFSVAPQKGVEGKALSTVGGTALTAGSLSASGALGSGALAAGVSAAALPVAIGAGALLAINQGAKAIAGEQDEFGVYKNDKKAGWGGLGNIADTMGKAKDLKDNKEQYAYLTGDSESSIKATGRLGRIPVFGTVHAGGDINKVKRKARDRTLELNELQSDFEANKQFSDTKEYNQSKYGTTFANGGRLGEATSTFKAGGALHENGGVSIGDNKEIEKGELVYKGYVFSDRLPYKK